MKQRLAIVGAGELGLQIANIALSTLNYEIAVFFDDTIEVGTEPMEGFKVLGRVDDVDSFYHADCFDCLMIAIGYKHMEERKRLYDKFSQHIPFATIIHHSCLIDGSAKIGNGTILYPGCIIDKNVTVGENVLLNLGVTVAHDTTLGSNCFVAPRVTFSGFVAVEESCFFGTGAIIVDNILIKSRTIIGAGSIVNRSFEKEGIYVGNPAKKLSRND